MPHQAIRKPQVSTAEKPGAWLSCLCALAPNVCIPSKRGTGNRSAGIHQHQTEQPNSRQQRNEGAGMGNPYSPMSRARINGAGKLARARDQTESGRHCAIITEPHRSKSMSLDLKGFSESARYNYYVKYSDISNSINGLAYAKIGQCVSAPQQSHCSKGAPLSRPALGNQSRSMGRHGPGILASAGNSLVISDTYDQHQTSPAQRQPRGRPSIRRTPAGLLKFPITETGRRQGGAPQ